MRRRLLLAGAASVAVVAVGGVWLAARLEAPAPAAATPVPIGGPFELVRGDGKAVADAEFRGRLMMVFFGFTFCPDICPTELTRFGEVLDELGPDAARVQPVFISVDPERDKPPVVAAYMRNFDPRIVGLTGSPEQVAAAAKAYRVYYGKSGDETSYTVDHSTFTYLMGPDGQFLTFINYGATTDEMLAKIRPHLAG